MLWQLRERLPDVCCVGRNEQRMIEPAPDKRHLDIVTIASQFDACSRNVLAILLTTRIGVLRRRNETDGPTQTSCAQFTQRVRQQWMPVAHSDVDRKRMTGGSEAILQTCGLLTCDPRDGRHAAEELVVVSDLLDALWAHAPAAQDVREKRADVVEPLRSTERNDEHGVENGQPPSA